MKLFKEYNKKIDSKKDAISLFSFEETKVGSSYDDDGK
jgi:hypothetical protein